MIRAHFRTAAACALILLAAACGGGSPTAPTPPPAVVTTTLSGTVQAYGISSQPFTPQSSGTYTVTLTWTATADLDLYVTAASCSGYPPDACSLLALSTASSGAREEVTLVMTGGTPLLLWIDNFGLTPIAYTVVVRAT